ncbi:MAG: sulfotransferase family protein [Promethearchaeota archaeon]
MIIFNLESIDFSRIGPIFGFSFRDSLKLIMSNGFIPVKHYMRIVFINTISIVGILFRIREYLLYDRHLKNYKLTSDPIFIIGHWRSGTTHLHNLLCQDPQFGFITMLQASFPKSFLSTSFFSFFMRMFLPETRPMDNIRMGVEETQEDEMALGNIFPYTLYNAWYFPKRILEYYHKYVRFKRISPRIKKIWKKGYNYLLRKATFNMGGKQLVLKNPANTARIKFLLELYPNAKFIHIYRNPYTIYLSTRYFYKKTMENFMFQNVSNTLIEDSIIKIYKDMMECYLTEKKLIPKGNLVEIKFEDLEKDAIGQLKRIYDILNLPGFDTSRSSIEDYLEHEKNYKKNKFQLSKGIIDKIEKQWGFTIKKWGYKIPESTF